MIKYTFALLCLACTLAGCGKSSVQLLKDGDAAVCAKSDVLDDLVEIVKQQASIPQGKPLIADYDTTLANYLSKVTFTTDQVTSTAIDASTRNANCNARVTMKADGADERWARFDYSVSADLSNDKPIVLANVSMAAGQLNTILGELTSGLIEQLKAKKVADDEILTDQYEQAWSQANQGEVETLRKDITSRTPTGRFNNNELQSLIRIEALKKQCEITSDDEKTKICERATKLDRESPFCLAIGKWIHCGSSEEQQADQEARDRAMAVESATLMSPDDTMSSDYNMAQ